MQAIRVSVIVATAGVSPFLEAVLRRARAQTDENGGELLVAWNGAADDQGRAVPDSVRALADRVVHEPRPGKSHALNAGVRVARGEFCAFLDDDGEPQPGWLAALLDPLENDPRRIAGVGGRVLPVHEGPSPRWYQRLVHDRACFFLGPSHDLGDRRMDYPPERMGICPLGANCAYRRELLLSPGYSPALGPNRQTGSRGGEDTLLAMQLQGQGERLVYEPRAVVRHPVLAERMTPEYVERAYYWQGVEHVRMRRILGQVFRGSKRLKIRRRLFSYEALLALSPFLPEDWRLAWRQRAARQRGMLDELLGRVAPALALLFALCLAGCGKTPAATRQERPNVVLVVIDTLRADHLGSYGYSRATSPQLDRIAKESVLFEQAFSPAPRTVAAHASLFTSTYPSVHGVWNEPGPLDEEREFQTLAPSAVCLAEVLNAAGYSTAAIADGGWMQKNRGLAQGFAKFSTSFRGAANRVDAALEWLRSMEWEPPFFLFLHTYEVHTPYLPPPELLADLEPDYQGPLRKALEDARAYQASGPKTNTIVEVQRKFFQPLLAKLDDADRRFLVALYDAEIRSADRELGRLFKYLRDSGLLDDTILIITSDHGEELGDHGKFEHVQVFDECLRIPLFVRLPDGPRGVVRTEPIELIDVMPSLLSELKIRVPAAAQGRDLRWREPDSGESLREIWGETNAPEPQIAWRRGSTKVLLRGTRALAADKSRPEAFDLARDPSERSPIAPDALPSGLFEEIQGKLAARRGASLEHRERFKLQPLDRSEKDLSDDQVNELRALGYL